MDLGGAVVAGALDLDGLPFRGRAAQRALPSAWGRVRGGSASGSRVRSVLRAPCRWSSSTAAGSRRPSEHTPALLQVAPLTRVLTPPPPPSPPPPLPPLPPSSTALAVAPPQTACAERPARSPSASRGSPGADRPTWARRRPRGRRRGRVGAKNPARAQQCTAAGAAAPPRSTLPPPRTLSGRLTTAETRGRGTVPDALQVVDRTRKRESRMDHRCLKAAVALGVLGLACSSAASATPRHQPPRPATPPPRPAVTPPPTRSSRGEIPASRPRCAQISSSRR